MACTALWCSTSVALLSVGDGVRFRPVRRYLSWLVLALACVAHTGCGGPTYWRNSNPSANWDRDLYECTKAHSVTITSGGGTGAIGTLNTAQVGSVRTDYAMRDLCLKSRGWYQTSGPSSPSTPPSVATPPSFTTPPSAPPPASTPASVSPRRESCPDGYSWNYTIERCAWTPASVSPPPRTACPTGYYRNSANGRCEWGTPCPAGYYWSSIRDRCHKDGEK